MNDQRSGTAQLLDALRAYSSAYPCPGFEIEPGLTTGCDATSHDCPTCAVVTALEKA